MKKSLFLFCALFCMVLGAGVHKSFPAPKVRLSSGLPVIANSPQAEAAAKKLSTVLEKIYKKPFPIQKGDGTSGIAVGTPEDFPAAPGKAKFDAKSIYEQQGFEIQTHANGIQITGISSKALEYGANELLYRLGWRHFMPSANWEIVPANAPAELALHIREIPDYATRQIQTPWDIHYSKWFSPAEKRYKLNWFTSQFGGGFDLRTNHIFERFVRENKKTLDAHPEYLSLWKGQRIPAQICISNPGLRKLFIDWQLANIRKDPKAASVSVDPADNTKWCQCDNCKAMGIPATRITTLANETAAAIKAAGLNQVVAFYAYNAHCAPPEIKVAPGVVVNICTAFLLYGWSPEKLVGAWQKQNASCGIREYYYVGRTPVGGSSIVSLEYAARTIPAFYKQGARYMTAEFTGNFGSCLPGVNAAFRLLWDINTDAEAIFKDFVEKSFPSAIPEMAEFFRLMNRAPLPDMSEDLLARFYKLLQQARKKAASSESEMRRLDDLVCFVRYGEMIYHTPGKRIENMQFVDATRNTKMIYSYSAHRRVLRYQGKKVDDQIKWQTHAAPTRNEIENFITEGLKKNKRFTFEPKSFSKDLVPVKFPGKNTPGTIEPIRKYKEYLLWSDGKPFTMSITGGLIKKYRNRGNVKVELIQIGGISEEGTVETVVDRNESTKPNGKLNKITLTPKYPGLHRLTVSDGNDRTQIAFPAGLPVCFDSSIERGGPDSGTFYFYVPAGTKVLGFYQDTWRGNIVAPNGKKFPLGKKKGNSSFNIPQGQCGKVWKLHYCGGNVKLLTVPPQFSLQSNYMLLPKDAK